LDVFLGRTLHLCEDFTVSRVDGFEGGIAAGVRVRAIDVKFLQFETGHSVLASALVVGVDHRGEAAVAVRGRAFSVCSSSPSWPIGNPCIRKRSVAPAPCRKHLPTARRATTNRQSTLPGHALRCAHLRAATHGGTRSTGWNTDGDR